MRISHISPDQVVYWHWGPLPVSATLVFTWVVLAVLVTAAWLITRRLRPGPPRSRWQALLEMIVELVYRQIGDIAHRDPRPFLPFIGTLFLFILVSNLLAVVPGFIPPTASLSTTLALALCVFVAVPVYGIASEGVLGYLKNYIKPTVFMLPFNIIGELSRTLALAVRLFGNIMSGGKIVAIVLAVAVPWVESLLLSGSFMDRLAAVPVALGPLLFAVVISLLGLLTGVIQAYIFAILAIVYIASATEAHQRTPAAHS